VAFCYFIGVGEEMVGLESGIFNIMQSWFFNGWCHFGCIGVVCDVEIIILTAYILGQPRFLVYLGKDEKSPK
jgi:hypothetical protein